MTIRRADAVTIWRPERRTCPISCGIRQVRLSGEVVTGSCATGAREPGQDRKVAAFIGIARVPQIAWSPPHSAGEHATPGGVRERPNRHAWKACEGQPSVGSNPTLSATGCSRTSAPRSHPQSSDVMCRYTRTNVLSERSGIGRYRYVWSRAVVLDRARPRRGLVRRAVLVTTTLTDRPQRANGRNLPSPSA